ncbi:MAG: undecaprenyl/decaprenyl-phosphate alpha-N-acetylglucosaminyl 1-phosphate transferase [Bacteroidales bacterium]|nr:undecaprenyl/decaprenyl-phosphate alpha-N-acetylglucosaminyl 1-phosphate transferase [Bacteroidales bacterium]
MQFGGIIFGFLTSLAISILSIPSIVTVARRKKLFDKPQGRKPRRKEVPTLGGLAIFAGTIISLALFSDVSQFPELPYIIAGSVILFFIGIKDDILIIAPWWKLSGQVLAAGIISIVAGLKITSLNMFPWMSEPGHTLAILITILVIVFIINSFNLIDGIDGLASGIGICSSLVLGWIFIQSGLLYYALLSFIFCGSLLGFFYYNVFSRKKKILMGDTGSLIVGFISSILVIRFIGMDNPALAGVQISSPQSLALAIFIIPVADMIKVIMTRISLGRSPFKPDRLHIHYRLIDLGLRHLQATIVLLLINAVMVSGVLILQNLGETILTIIVISCTILLYMIEWWLTKRNKKKIPS